MSHRILFMVVGAVVVAACGPSTDVTSPMKSPHSAASFDRPLVNAVVPATDVTTNPCNGDLVTVSGNTHVVETVDPTTGAPVLRVNFDDLKGVGVPSGEQYHVNGSQDLTLVFDNNTLLFETEIDQEVISQGSDTNFLVHEVILVDPVANTTTIVPKMTKCTG